MAFEFLTDEHLARYGRYPAELSADQLGEHFYLPDDLRARLQTVFRHDHTRLGYAIQRCTLQHLGCFLTAPTDVPEVVLKVVAGQLGMHNAAQVLSRYRDRRRTAFEHQVLIRRELGFRDFDGAAWLQLVRWLYARLHLGNERPSVLFDDATRLLIAGKIVLPGAYTLARLIVRVRERITNAAYVQVARQLSARQQAVLEDLLIVPPKSRLSPFEQLRSAPTVVSSRGLLGALDRLSAIRQLNLNDLDLSPVPPGRLEALRRDGLTDWAHTIARMAMPRRYATLVVTLRHLEFSATDDALDVLDGVMNGLGLKGERKRRQDRLRHLKDLDGAALMLRDALRTVLDEGIPATQVRARLNSLFGTDQLTLAMARVTELASPVQDQDTEAWLAAASGVQSFFPAVLRHLTFDGTPGAKPLLDAIHFLQQARPVWSRAPSSFIPKAWESAVYPLGGSAPDRRIYQLCVAHQLHGALKRREIFVPRSLKYGDPRAQLLQGEAWEVVRGDVMRALNLPEDPGPYLDALGTTLDAAYRTTVANLPENSFVRMDGDVPVITPLEKIPDTQSYVRLERETDVRLPIIDLSELLLETNAAAPFVDAMIEAVDGRPRRGDLAVSICAVLVAEACNIGLKAVSRSNIPALTLGRLLFVRQHYVRADTLLKANAVLVDAQSKLPLAQVWGGGEVASADGLRGQSPYAKHRGQTEQEVFRSPAGHHPLRADQRPVHHPARPGDSGHPARLAVHLVGGAGAADEPAPHPDHE